MRILPSGQSYDVQVGGKEKKFLKSRHASSSFLQAFYRFHQEKKQKDPALREEKKLKLLKNGRNLFAFESIWFIWKRGIHGFESNTECFELAFRGQQRKDEHE